MMKKEKPSSPKLLTVIIVVLGLLLIAAAIWIGILVSDNGRLRQQYDTLAANYIKMGTELDGLKAAAQEPNAELTAANNAVAALQGEYDTYKTEAEKTLSALQAEFDQYKLTAEADLAAARKALADLQAEFDQYKADAEAKLAAAAVTDQGKAIADLQAEFDTYKLDAEQKLAAAADTEQSKALAALQAEFDAFKADAEAAKEADARELSSLQAAFDAYQADTGAGLTSANQALAALQAEFDAYKTDAETKLAALTAPDQDAALTALQAVFDAYKADAEQKLAAAADTQAEADKASGSLAALQAEFDSYKQKTEGDLAAAAQAQTDHQAAYDAYKAGADQALTDAAAAEQTRKAEADAALAALKAEFDAYKTVAEADKTALAETKETLAAAEQTVAKMTVPADENGAGNQVNGNLAVFYKGDVYYQNNYENGNIYVQNASGFGDTYLRRTSSGPISLVRNIAAIDDGNLYYINNNRLNRLNLKTMKADYMKNNMDLYSADGMHVYGEKAYFLKSPFDAEGAPRDNLFDIKFSCNNLEAVPGVRADSFLGDGQFLYYAETGTGRIVKFDLETGTGEQVYQGASIRSMNLAGDRLYFSDNGQILTVKTDGTELSAVGTAMGNSLNVIGDWIFYSNLSDHEKIYRITTDGRYDEKVFDVENTCCLSIAGGWIYFIQYQGTGDQWTVVDTYKARLDGTGLTLAKP